MTLTVVEQDFATALTAYNLAAGGTYNSANLGLGPLMMQNVGGSNLTNWVGPLPVGRANPFETSLPVPGIYPHAITWDAVNNIDWIFLADNASPAVSRHIILYTYNRNTGVYNWQGVILLNPPPASGNSTIHGIRATYDLTNTGTVAVSGTAVTGTSTLFSTNKCCVGNRIGFGSTNPTQITTWYYISAIGSDTSITLTTSAGTITGGTPFVIEDLRIVMVTTNVITTNCGLFVAKGLNFSQFTSTGTSIPAATTIDNITAVYWLADASIETMTTVLGVGLDNFVDYGHQYVWCPNGNTAANTILYQYNLRAALTLTSGKDPGNSLVVKTGAPATALTGIPTVTNNARIMTMASGSGSGLDCLYFVTPTRIYRTIALGSITNASTNWIADNSVENPPGGVNTYPLTGALGQLDYSSLLDKIIISPSVPQDKTYITGYITGGGEWDRIFQSYIGQLGDTANDSTVTNVPNDAVGAPSSIISQGGVLHMFGVGGTALTSVGYAIPYGADWEYAATTGCEIILPAMNTPNCSSYSRAYVNEIQVLTPGGGDSGHNLGMATEPFRIYYRTAGISGNTGGWTLVDYSGDLSSVGGATQIQFKLQFRTLGAICIPARILNVGVVYNDNSTDSHYQPSASNSNAASNIFAWRFATAFGTSVPTLYVRLYDAVLGSLLVTDNTASPTGTFEKSTNGGSTWVAWTNADRGGSSTTYIRYTPASLGSGINVSATLTLS